MIEPAWRLQRLVFLVALAVVVAFATWLAVTGSLQAAAWTSYNVTHHCVDVVATRNNCFALGQNYQNLNRLARVNLGLAVAMPGLLGLVLGAPLVAREIEQGTNRLAWTQSITRTRWLLVKLGVGALACCVVVGATTPLLEWWTGAIHRGARVVPSLFDISGFVAVSYVLFAFMLGAALGALIRRTGWAFAVGIPLYALARLGVQNFARPALVSPSTAAGFPANAWILQSGYVPLGRSSPATGQTWESGYQLVANCLSKVRAVSLANENRCIAQNKLHYLFQYQPTSHFWTLQGAESAIFVGAAIVLLGVTVLAVRRWRT
jgi:ABC-type transport system involved in multi-copper enzyme maturation permease subunit